MATPPTAWLTPQEQRAWRAFLRSHTLLLARLHRQLQRDAGLSLADYEVLANLSEAADGRLRAFRLAASLQWEKSRLSHHLTRMEQRGLVTREECSSDARGAFVALTEEGRRTIASAAPAHVGEVRRSFIDPLTPEQLELLATVSERIMTAAGEGGGAGGDCEESA